MPALAVRFDPPLSFVTVRNLPMYDCALCISLGRWRPALILGLSLSAVGCSSETAPTEKREPATKHLKYIEELQKKGAAPASSPGKRG
jgi:hypothetical protein